MQFNPKQDILIIFPKNHPMKRFTFLFLLVSVPMIASSQTYTGKQKDIDAILAEVKAFSEYVMAGDAQKIAASYTSDAKIFPNKRDILSGRETIQNYWTLPSEIKIIYHKVIPQEIRVQGKEAYDYGYYEGTTQRADGTEVSWKGKYVIVWKKVGKKWKIYLDIWNRIEE